MTTQRWLIAACGLLALSSTSLQCCKGVAERPITDATALVDGFLVKPYLQLGDVPPGVVARDLRVLWQTADQEAGWALEYRPAVAGPWLSAEAPAMRRVAVPGIEPHRVYRATVRGLTPGSEFAYRVRRGGRIVFMASGRALRPASQPYRFAVFGDCAAGTAAQRTIADQAYRARPDFVLIAGDIVYTRGRIAEYRAQFWPVYNADVAAPGTGAPLLRSTLVLAAPGNHDIDRSARDLGKYPDGLAYFLYWDH
jgi:hypothetical protein